MKIQTKITLLLTLVILTFLVGLAALRISEQIRFRRIAVDRFKERTDSFEDFLRYNGEPLKTLSEYFTCWDQMVQAVATGNVQWATENMSNSTLESYHANCIWIAKPDGSLFFHHNNLSSPDLREFPVPKEVFPELFVHSQLCHFFAKVPQGVMEIRGATIHPSKDFRRESPQKGYLFAGRLWSNETVREMSLFTSNDIRLEPGETPAVPARNDEQNGLVVFSRTLSSWDEKPIARLVIKNESGIVKALNRSGERLLFALVIFALVLFLLLSISLVLWVSRPLRLIMLSLKRDDPKPIQKLCGDHSEFGELARMIHRFFEQRMKLLREMEERRATEQALHKSEEELRQSQKMEAVGRLAGGIAHDFNNLLTAIIGYAEMVSARSSSDPATRQNADLILKAGEQAAALTRQLLAFSRKQLLQPRIIDLNELVCDIEKLLRRVIGEHFDLRTVPDASDGRVMADPSQIEQVILNLGVNARDAMPRGGKLTIRTCNEHLDAVTAPKIFGDLAPGHYVVLEVADSGCGMDETVMSHIFEPFFTTKEPGKGTGLGLATVYGVVRQSGGGISVQSEQGKGTTFRIYLPIEAGIVEHAKPLAPEVEPTRHGETIMVVEDEDIVRELVCEILSEKGYTVIAASQGFEAIETAAQYRGKIDLLVTDVIMPKMSGQELAVTLTRLRPDMKVLYISGYSDNDIGEHGILASGIELLEKPFTPRTLARKIQEVLSNPLGAEVAVKS